MRLPIAIQLYSVRNSMQKDVEGTLVALKNRGAIMLVMNWVSRAMTEAAIMP